LKNGCGFDWNLMFDVRQTVTFGVNDLAVFDDGDSEAGNALFLHFGFEIFIHLGCEVLLRNAGRSQQRSAHKTSK
jgi:hypothetical protein